MYNSTLNRSIYLNTETGRVGAVDQNNNDSLVSRRPREVNLRYPETRIIPSNSRPINNFICVLYSNESNPMRPEFGESGVNKLYLLDILVSKSRFRKSIERDNRDNVSILEFTFFEFLIRSSEVSFAKFLINKSEGVNIIPKVSSLAKELKIDIASRLDGLNYIIEKPQTSSIFDEDIQSKLKFSLISGKVAPGKHPSINEENYDLTLRTYLRKDLIVPIFLDNTFLKVDYDDPLSVTVDDVGAVRGFVSAFNSRGSWTGFVDNIECVSIGMTGYIRQFPKKELCLFWSHETVFEGTFLGFDEEEGFYKFSTTSGLIFRKKDRPTNAVEGTPGYILISKDRLRLDFIIT